MNRIFIDTFSIGLDELPIRKQKSITEVLRVLHECGRYSIFEATATQYIAKTMDAIIKRGYVETENAGYPWTKAKLTEKGLLKIKEDSK